MATNSESKPQRRIEDYHPAAKIDWTKPEAPAVAQLAPAAATVLTDEQTGVARLAALIAEDSYAMTFQSMGQYRTALLKAARTIEAEVLAQAGVRAEPAAPVQTEEMVRFCPHCARIGEIGTEYRDCCPDGSAARYIPRKLAEVCRDTFKLAIGNVAAPTIPAQVPAAEVRTALQPFADLAELFDDENRGANMPSKNADPVMQWPRLHKNYELTVGHLRAARSALAQSSTADKATEVRAAEWISTKDELPKDGEMVRIFCPDPYPETWESPWVESQQAFVSNVHGWVGKDEVPYWHRLPAAPAVDGQQGGGGA